jgi:putative serine/threonine protein kinase
MFDYLISKSLLERFYSHLEGLGIGEIGQYGRGTTSLIFTGQMDGVKVVVKLQRPDSPRRNLLKEARVTKAIEPFKITTPLVRYGTFEGLEYLVRVFAPGEPLIRADVEKGHLFKIVEKTALLDRIGLDHGQIQGGKHIILGQDVYIIDFEKANWRKTKNLTSAVAMLFLNDNFISRRVREKFQLDGDFLTRMKACLRLYKRSRNLSCLLELLSEL